MRLRHHLDGALLRALEQPQQDRLQLLADGDHADGVGRIRLGLRAADGQRLLVPVQVGPLQLADLGRAPEPGVAGEPDDRFPLHARAGVDELRGVRLRDVVGAGGVGLAAGLHVLERAGRQQFPHARLREDRLGDVHALRDRRAGERAGGAVRAGPGLGGDRGAPGVGVGGADLVDRLAGPEVLEQGIARAQDNLGVMYTTGSGVAKDEAKAVEWFRKAAEQGIATAQVNLGWMYRNGTGVAKDEAKAFEWYRKAAEQGYATAQNNLGSMYRNGMGVAKDEAKAVEWYRKAVEQGLAEAQSNLGGMYLNGTGVAKDEAKAVEWYRKAAEQGHAKAQNNLGTMYRDGTGVAKDPITGYAWLSIAAKAGYVPASHALSELRLAMSRSDIAVAERRAVELQPKPAVAK